MQMTEVEQTLRWPDSWPRTRFQDRKSQAAWKKSYADVLKSLEKELKRLGATSFLVTHNDRTSQDSGVAVYFTLKPVDLYGWQEALGFIGQVPTIHEIDRAYMERAKRIHPDGPTPDPVLFHTLTEHRERAKAWARGEQTREHDKVIACDVFREVRWNLNAVRMTIFAMRQIERCGASVMIERAWRGFAKALAPGGAPLTPTVTDSVVEARG